ARARRRRPRCGARLRLVARRPGPVRQALRLPRPVTGLRPEMRGTPRLGQRHLALALAEARAVRVRELVAARGAGDTLLEIPMRAVRRREGPSAGAAQPVASGRQTVAHAHPLVEDEASALPEALRFRNFLQILQDSALEVEDLRDALPQEEARGFLAADAAGAEHGHAPVAEPGGVRAPPRREVAEARGARIDCAAKTADRPRVGIARVDDDDILGRDQRVPVGRL